MAQISKMFAKLIGLEFNSPANALHWNEGEKGWTYMGIYEFAHPNWEGWSRVKSEIDRSGKVKASAVLYYDVVLGKLVEDFYEKQFWDKMRLDEVASQDIAEDMMCMAVNAGIPTAVKLAQRLIGATVDGVLGSKTIKALNEVDAKWFDAEYDKLEVEYYEKLAKNNPNFVKFLNGWRNRAVAF